MKAWDIVEIGNGWEAMLCQASNSHYWLCFYRRGFVTEFGERPSANSPDFTTNDSHTIMKHIEDFMNSDGYRGYS